jgi:exopolyphosphatase/guanosine-5'-triphosphate,3'-diphosphate pyrophosphatase
VRNVPGIVEPKLKVGVIDIGTNSVRLLLAETRPYRVCERKVLITRLGEGIGEKLSLSSRAVERTLEAVEEFISQAKSWGAEKIFVAGTQALREAENAFSFWEKLKERTGIEGKTLSEEEEAKFSFKGVLSGLFLKGKALVVDIGGGSTEFIAGDPEKIDYLRSFPLGSVRISEMFLMKNDPPLREEVEEAFAYARESLSELPPFHSYELVGVAGTVTTVVAILEEMERYDSQKVHGYLLHKERISEVLLYLSSLNLEERRKVRGLEPKRADVIIGGIIILLSIMEREKKETMLVSESDLLDGIALSLEK